ncbi:MAG: EamA family transporter [Actinobacteria bacterium]|nr:EamA family transporter [Actinomycetota bacterium]
MRSSLRTPAGLDLRVASGLLVLYVAWGTTYLGMRVVVRTIPPLLGASLRFALAGAILLLLLAARDGWRSLRLGRRELLLLAATGALVPGIGNGLNQIAVDHATSVMVALLNATVTLWVVLLRWLGRARPHGLTLGAVGVGFGGVALVLLPGREVDADAVGIVLALCASFAWAAGSIASSLLVRGIPPLVAVGFQMLVGAFVQALAGIAAGELDDFQPADFSLASLSALAYLITIGGFLSYSVYAWLLQNARVSQVATYAFVNPIVAVLLGWAILGETLAWASVVGALVVVAAVAVIVRKEA